MRAETRAGTDERGVSSVFGYTLTLGIGTLLIVGLVMAAGGHVDDQRERVTETELQVIGAHVSADIAAADRMHRTDGTTEVNVSRSLQNTVVGSPYRMHVRDNESTQRDGPTRYYLELEAVDGDVTVVVGIATLTPLEETTVDGGDVEVFYDDSAGQLVVRNA